MKRTSYNCKQNKKVATDRNSDWYRKNKDVMDRTGDYLPCYGPPTITPNKQLLIRSSYYFLFRVRIAEFIIHKSLIYIWS